MYKQICIPQNVETGKFSKVVYQSCYTLRKWIMLETLLTMETIYQTIIYFNIRG